MSAMWIVIVRFCKIQNSRNLKYESKIYNSHPFFQFPILLSSCRISLLKNKR